MFNHRRKSCQRTYLGILLATIVLCVVFAPISGYALANGPSEVINKLNSSLLEAMKGGGKLGYEGRYRLLNPVIRESFALSRMARMATGKYWDTFSKEERDVYLNTYSQWSVASYAGRFNEYSGEQFKVVSESLPERNTVSVISKLIENNKEEVEFNYQFRLVDGSWRIVDIRILGISQLALTRAQFVSILGVKGFNGLISLMNGKIVELSKSNEK
ncbi:MAG: ABC transporter substrate-binding protein [Geobacteraceae bacterium]|nr:ABC transporter substrate-binding protein [Geobacteraceae bacterium]